MSISVKTLLELEAQIEVYRQSAQKFAQYAALTHDLTLKSVFEENSARHEKWRTELAERKSHL